MNALGLTASAGRRRPDRPESTVIMISQRRDLTCTPYLAITPCMPKARPLSRDAYERKAQIIKALAHPSRLMIVDALSEGEKCVNDLTEIVGSDMSTVSKHLTLMKSAGLVVDRKQGLQVIYRLRVPCILNFFGCVDAVLRANEESWRAASGG